MFRHVLLGCSLAAAVFGSAPAASATPICISGAVDHPAPRTVPLTCVPYPLEVGCEVTWVDLGTLAYAYVITCVPSPLLNPPDGGPGY